jgi:quercetin dioxygenase-like cupin family protein
MTDVPPRQTPAGQILLSGHDTAGRYTLIDMHVPPGGCPPPHRRDFEEMFSILDGEIELTFRGETSTTSCSNRAKPNSGTTRPKISGWRRHVQQG